MQHFVFILSLLAAATAQAHEWKEHDFECHREARTALARFTHQHKSHIFFWEGAKLGDGAASLEIMLFFVQEPGGARIPYKLEYNLEGCDRPLSIEAMD